MIVRLSFDLSRASRSISNLVNLSQNSKFNQINVKISILSGSVFRTLQISKLFSNSSTQRTIISSLDITAGHHPIRKSLRFRNWLLHSFPHAATNENKTGTTRSDDNLGCAISA